jgi:hypothetical protein
MGKANLNTAPAEVPKATKTPEQLKAVEAKRAERIEARKRVLAFVKANEEQLDTIAADIRLFVGHERAARAPRASINTALRTAFLAAHEDGKGLSEMEIFKMFKIGRPMMAAKMRILVLTANPTDRVWVAFDEPNETYNVVGTGAKPPKNWDGYVPAEKENL